MPDNQSPIADRQRLLAGLVAGGIAPESEGDESVWLELVALAEKEGLAPLLAHRIGGQEAHVPASIREKLEPVRLHAIGRSLLYESLRRRLCARLARSGVPVMLLKGAALAFTCYEDPATRPMGDLDLLVAETDVPAAAHCLEQEGLGLVAGALDPTPRSPRGHLAYVHATVGAVVELHWTLQLFGRAREKALAEIWSGARPFTEPTVPGARPSVVVMRTGHAIPFLSAHAILQHQEPRLLWFYDLHRLLLTITAEEAEVVQSAAARWGIQATTARALQHVRHLFGSPLPNCLSEWAEAEGRRQTLQGRVADAVLARDPTRLPRSDFVDVLMGRDWGLLRALFPTPRELREREDFGKDARLLPAYLALMRRHVRNGLPHLGRACRLLIRRSGEG